MAIRKQAAHLLKWNGDEPAVDQGLCNGFSMSWNPDDNRYYVQVVGGDTLATFKDWRNAVQYARRKINP